MILIVTADRWLVKRNMRTVEKGSKISIKTVFGQQQGKTISLEIGCSVMLNHQFEIVGDEFFTSNDHYDESM